MFYCRVRIHTLSILIKCELRGRGRWVNVYIYIYIYYLWYHCPLSNVLVFVWKIYPEVLFDTWADVNGQTLSGVSQGQLTSWWTLMYLTWGTCWWNICGNAVVVWFWPQINFVWFNNCLFINRDTCTLV